MHYHSRSPCWNFQQRGQGWKYIMSKLSFSAMVTPKPRCVSQTHTTLNCCCASYKCSYRISTQDILRPTEHPTALKLYNNMKEIAFKYEEKKKRVEWWSSLICTPVTVIYFSSETPLPKVMLNFTKNCDLRKNMNRHITFKLNQNADVSTLWQPQISQNFQIRFLCFLIDKEGTLLCLRCKSCPAFQLANHEPDNFCFSCTINYFGLFLKKLFQKVLQKVINMHYSSDPGNLGAFIKSFQNNWNSVRMFYHNINVPVLTKMNEKQVIVQTHITSHSEQYFLKCFYLNVFLSKRWIVSKRMLHRFWLYAGFN